MIKQKPENRMKNGATPFWNKLEWLLITIVHLILLYWIFHILENAGSWETKDIFLHFTGVSLYGACLIRFCAWLYMRKYKKESGR